MRWWPKARYKRVAYILVLAPIVLSAPIIFGLVSEATAPYESLRLFLIATVVLLNLSAITGLIHLSWICPYLATNDDEAVFI